VTEYDAETLAVYASNVADYVAMTHKQAGDPDVASFISAIPKGGYVLDLGCGPGRSTAAMIAAGLRADATDASPEMIKAAFELFQIKVKLATFTELDAIGTYDGVYASFCLLHAPKTDFLQHLKRIHTALKPGGVLHLGMKLGAGETRDTFGRFYAYYSENELWEHLIAAGFRSVATLRAASGSGLSGEREPFISIGAYA